MADELNTQTDTTVETTPEGEDQTQVAESTETPPVDSGISDEVISRFTDEYSKNGKLSAESIAELTKRGIPEKLVTQYIQGQTALIERQRSDVLSVVGGEKAFEAFQKWADKGLSNEEKQAFNKALESGDTSVAKTVLSGLYSKYTAQNGTKPKLLSGTKGPTGPKPFNNVHEMVKAQQDPKYQTDPSYRNQVEQRIRAAVQAGLI